MHTETVRIPSPEKGSSSSLQLFLHGHNSGFTWLHEDAVITLYGLAGRIDQMGEKAALVKESFFDPNHHPGPTTAATESFSHEYVVDFNQFLDTKKIREAQSGLRIFVQTCKRWALDQESQLALLGYASTDPAGKNVLAGHVPNDLQPLIDRVAHIIAISIGLGILYDENTDAEKHWLEKPRRILDNRSPFDCMQNAGMDDLITINRMVERERGL